MSSPSSEERNGLPPASGGSFLGSRFSWRAVLVGFVVYYGGCYVAAVIIVLVAEMVRVAEHQSRASMHAWLHTTPIHCVNLVFGLLFVIAGGFAAGRTDPPKKYWNAAAIVFLAMAWTTFLVHTHPPLDPPPEWIQVVDNTATLPCALLGAFLGEIGATEPPAPPPLPRAK